MILPEGYMLTGSKGRYRHQLPDHVIVFNSVVEVDGKQVWSGDIDLSIQDHMEFLVFELMGQYAENLCVYQEGARECILEIDQRITLGGPRVTYTFNEKYYEPVHTEGHRVLKFVIKDYEDTEFHIDTTAREGEFKEGLTAHPLRLILFEGGDPMVTFYTSVSISLKVSIHDLDVSDIYVSKMVAEDLNKKLKEYILKHYTYNGELDEYGAAKEYGMTHLMFSPVCLKGLDDDKFYIKENKDE